MSRIRTIKPDFWTDEKIVDLSAFARLLFIGMWNFVDDEGRAEYSPRQLKMRILPADDVDVTALVGEIRRQGLIKVYDIDGKEYFEVKGFTEHQKIDKRRPSKIPSAPNRADARRIAPNCGPGRKEGEVLEGSGKEGIPSGRDAPENVSPEVAPSTEDRPDWWPRQDRYGRIVSEVTEKITYDVGKAVLGKSAGGQVTKLRKLYHHDLRAVTDLLLQAEAKGDASQWIAGVIRKGELGEKTSISHEVYPETVYKAAS